MKESKHLDRLFQEKFKDFEAAPNKDVWVQIAAKRDQNDRKIIPFWFWRLGGIAALVAIVISIGIFWNNTKTVNSPKLVNAPTNPVQNDVNTNPTGISNIAEEGASPNLNTTVSQTPEESETKEQSILKTLSDNNQYLANQNTSRQNTNSTYSQRIGEVENAQKLVNKDDLVQNNIPFQTKKSHEESDQPENQFINNSPLVIPATEESVAIGEENEKSDELSQQNSKSLVEEASRIAQEDTDSPLENAARKGRWDVGAVAAPVFYGDFGGSGVDAQLSQNSTSTSANLSYGVQVSYAINNKFKIRSGVNNVDVSYNTNDISFAPGTSLPLEAINLNQVRTNSRSAEVAIFNNRNNNISNQVQGLNPNDFPGGDNIPLSDGSIVQSINYFEVPVEAVYVISDKKLGVEVVGGISTLLLNNDEIQLESQGARTTLGNSSALNSVSFTTNLGLGVNYKLSDAVKVNLEPSFKYQLNGFEGSVSDFRPYIFGIYTGVNYRF